MHLIHKGAVLPDLPLCGGEHLHVPHLHHGRREVCEELSWVAGDACLPQHVVPGERVKHERLVGGKERPALGDDTVVARVKRPEAPRVHLHKRRRVVGLALGFQAPGVLLVQHWVGHVRAAEVVQPVRKRRAV